MTQAEFCTTFGHHIPRGHQEDYSDALVEVCRDCGKKLVYNKAKDGTIDNNRYYQEHLRDFAQPRGPTAYIYERFYGKSKDAEAEKDKFYKEREEKRLEAWEFQMKKQGDGAFVKQVKSVVEGK